MSVNIKHKRTVAASLGFLAVARQSCYIAIWGPSGALGGVENVRNDTRERTNVFANETVIHFIKQVSLNDPEWPFNVKIYFTPVFCVRKFIAFEDMRI